MVCADCGSDNKPGRRFCRDCGRPLRRECPSCGTPNDALDRFCGECGASLEAAPTEVVADAAADVQGDVHERRYVVVLFADLVGFTEFSEQRDPERVRQALSAYFERAREIIARFGGTVEKFIGDAVMAVWGATVAREDDAERAVRAGLELTDTIARISAEVGGDGLDIRVGVLSGEASVAPATAEQGLVVGDLVNTASRLQSIAPPGTVVVGEATHRMLAGAVDFEPLGPHALKGKTEPVPVWRAVRVITDRTQRARFAGVEPPFVGRQDELRLLKDALHATDRAGRARLISVVGEPGIGKSRLAWELRKYVGGLAGDIYWHDGRSPAYDQGLTFWALGEMVRQRAGIAETDDALRSRTKLRTAVAEFVGTMRDQEWIEPRLAALLGLDDAPTGDRSEFFAAVRSFFQHIAERGTTVLVFEDFHWADAGLLDFVAELVERSPRHPILALTLARPDLLDRVPGWGAGRRDFTSTHLGPLSEAEMGELIVGLVQGIDESLVDAVVERANGVPLYAVELVRMMLADGDLVMDGDVCCVPGRDLTELRVPDTVRAVIGARLDRLPVDAKALLQDAAVLGASFTKAGLAGMSGLGEEGLDELLERLVHRELLEEESDPRSPERGQYRFVQSMIREVAYERLTRAERQVRHIRAAAFFADLGEIELAGAAASHLMAAHRAAIDPAEAERLATQALAALSDAADRAARLHSHAPALGHIEHAVAVGADPAARPRLWQRAARSAGALAQHETAVAYAYRAYDWYRDHGGRVEITDAASLVGDELCHAFRAPEAIEVLEPIVAATPDLTDRSTVTAGAELARAYLMALRDKDAAAMADRAIVRAERLDLVPTIVDTLITRGSALGNLGRKHEAIALLEGAMRFAREQDLPIAELRATNNLGHVLTYDDHVGAMEACRAGMELAERLGDVRFIGSFSWAVSAYLDRDGRFADALELRNDVRERIELPASSVDWYDLTDFIGQVVLGDAEAIEPAYDAVERSLDVANPQSQASVPATRAWLDLLTGRLESAFDGVMGLDVEHRFPDHLATAATAAALLGDVERLELVADALQASRARGRMLGAIRNVVIGSIAALEGRTDEAVAAFGRALNFPYLRLDRANVQALFATLVGRNVAEARVASDEAYETLRNVGAVAYLDLYASGLPAGEDRRAAGT